MPSLSQQYANWLVVIPSRGRHPTKFLAVISYNKKQFFGMLDFDTTKDDPTVTYTIVSIDGQPVHTLDVKRSQLSFPR